MPKTRFNSFTNYDGEEITKEEAIQIQIDCLSDMQIIVLRSCKTRTIIEERIKFILRRLCNNDRELSDITHDLKIEEISLNSWLIKYGTKAEAEIAEQIAQARWSAINASRAAKISAAKGVKHVH